MPSMHLYRAREHIDKFLSRMPAPMVKLFNRTGSYAHFQRHHTFSVKLGRMGLVVILPAGKPSAVWEARHRLSPRNLRFRPARAHKLLNADLQSLANFFTISNEGETRLFSIFERLAVDTPVLRLKSARVFPAWMRSFFKRWPNSSEGVDSSAAFP